MKYTGTLIVSALLTLATGTFSLQGAVIATFESAAHVGGNTAVDADLSIKASSSDLLNGLTPTSSATVDILAGGAAGFSDGLVGEQDFDPNGRGLFLGEAGSVVEYTSLGSITVGEIRVFSHNPDVRSIQGYSVSFDTGGGFGASVISIEGGDSTSAVVSRVFDNTGASLATGVVGIRLSFTDDLASTHGRVINEIDAFSASPVPEPSRALLTLVGVAAMGLRRRKG